MAQKKAKSAAINPKWIIWPLVIACVLLLAICGALVEHFTKLSNTVGMYELLEKIDNQACRYLDGQPEVNGSFDLEMNAPKDQPKLIYQCLTGEVTKDKVIHGKSIGSYPLGASVTYYSTNEEAYKYAEEKLNPLRYWGVDQEGQQNNIPQTSLFTFIVTDEPKLYFDAYTVKANAVLRVSLHCDNPEACHEKAESVLQRELKGVNVL